MMHDRAGVLFVDDSAADVELTLHALKQRGFIKDVQVARDGEQSRSIPVIVLTSSLEERDLLVTYNLCSYSYIQKPVDFDEFREGVNTLGQYWCRVNLAPPGGRSAGTGECE